MAQGGFGGCELGRTGAIYCHGLNSSGQVGDGTTISRSTPALVAGLATPVYLTTGYQHHCAVEVNGRIAASAPTRRFGAGEGRTRWVRMATGRRGARCRCRRSSRRSETRVGAATAPSAYKAATRCVRGWTLARDDRSLATSAAAVHQVPFPWRSERGNAATSPTGAHTLENQLCVRSRAVCARCGAERVDGVQACRNAALAAERAAQRRGAAGASAADHSHWIVGVARGSQRIGPGRQRADGVRCAVRTRSGGRSATQRRVWSLLCDLHGQHVAGELGPTHARTAERDSRAHRRKACRGESRVLSNSAAPIATSVRGPEGALSRHG